MNYGGVQASHTDACTPFCFPKNRNSHVRTSPCTIQKTYRAIRQGTGIPWPDSECGDGYWRYWNHCSIAALTTGGTQFGAFLDSTLDRIADWALLAGVVIFFILHADWWYDINRSSPDCISWIGIAAAMVSMMTSFVTSYARARAESVGFEVKNGIATRADRLVIILVGMAITGLTHQGLWLAIAMVLLAVLGLITVFQRILEARCQMAVGHKTYQL